VRGSGSAHAGTSHRPVQPQVPLRVLAGDEIWSAKAPSVRGVYGVGPTAEEAKDDLVEALEALSEHLKKSGENRKAAVCDRLVASWKTKTRRRKTSSRRS